MKKKKKKSDDWWNIITTKWLDFFTIWAPLSSLLMLLSCRLFLFLTIINYYSNSFIYITTNFFFFFFFNVHTKFKFKNKNSKNTFKFSHFISIWKVLNHFQQGMYVCVINSIIPYTNYVNLFIYFFLIFIHISSYDSCGLLACEVVSWHYFFF